MRPASSETVSVMTGMRNAAALMGALVLLAGCSSIVDRRGYIID